jgi:hypothetical protein
MIQTMTEDKAIAQGLRVFRRELKRFDSIQTEKTPKPEGDIHNDRKQRSIWVLKSAMIAHDNMQPAELGRQAGVRPGRVRTWLCYGIAKEYQPRKRSRGSKSEVQGPINLREQIRDQKTDLEKVCDVLGITRAQLWDKQDVPLAAMSLLHAMRPLMDASEQNRLIKFIRSMADDVLKQFGMAAK